MHFTAAKISLIALGACLTLGAASAVQAQARSSVVIPLKKERAAEAKVVTIHDTVTMVRVDTVKVVQTVVRTDTIFKVDTLRDSCSRGAIPIPIPIPLPLDHHVQIQPATLDPAMPTSVTPEPETFVMVGTGLAAMIGFSWYRKRK